MRKLAYSDWKISIKLSIMYMCFLVFSLSISLTIYAYISNQITIEKQVSLITQSLNSLETNIDNVITNVSNNSRIIIANNEIQQVIKEKSNTELVANQNRVSTALAEMVHSIPYVQSIYVFDNYGHRYGSDKHSLKSLKFESIEEASWYERAKDEKGYYIIEINADDIFWNGEAENTISLIRIINSTVTMKPIGTLMINISEEAFKSNYDEISSGYSPNILLLNENQKVIATEGDISKEIINEIFPKGLKDEKGSRIVSVNDSRYLFSYKVLSKYGWMAIMSIPIKELEREPYQVAIVVIIIMSGIFVMVSCLIMSHTITKPIERLVHSMKQMETGKFVKVDIETGGDEVGELKNHYNDMVDEIEKLIKRIYAEQQFKRTAELRMLQEQVKPHFLYNTIDAMRFLAYSGRNDELCEALEAFGNYYRTSLSKGSEIISLEEEINIVKDYLYLQKMRYGETIQFTFEIEACVLPYTVPKLILQPLVENAIYHGIKPKQQPGHIAIRSRLEENYILLEVEDDGVGMAGEKIATIMNNKASFGLRGTFERLNIFFERRDLYRIESEEDRGTKITLYIPIGGSRE